jgi:putative ABC transport system permease protein
MTSLALDEYAASSVRLMRARPLRTALSIAGIFVGVFAVLIILAIQEGERRQVESLYRVAGAQVVVALPSFDESTGRSGQLKPDDVERLREHPTVTSVLPRFRTEMAGRSETQSALVQILAIDEPFLSLYRVPLQEGRQFLPHEWRAEEAACLLSASAARKLFHPKSAVGQTLMLDKSACLVVGVVSWTAGVTQRASAGSPPDVLMPYATLTRLATSNHLPLIEVRFAPTTSAEVAKQQVTEILTRGEEKRRKHYVVQSSEDVLRDRRESTWRSLRSLLLVAGIGLLVGAIGIANVMLISVLERTREIGVRKALGATPRDILVQFLMESGLLSLLGALLALVTAGLVYLLAPWILPRAYALALPFGAAAAAFLITLLIGLVAGAYPAARAANLSAAEALRYE